MSRNTYLCVNPEKIIRGLLDFKVPNIIKGADRPYAFTGLSAIEAWSDYSYVQRGIEKSPYFIKILKKDVDYWKGLFGKYEVPVYTNGGTTIGEYVILEPVNKLEFVEKDDYKLISLSETEDIAKKNEIYSYPYRYMRRKYGAAAN
jgi:hypothetical protein